MNDDLITIWNAVGNKSVTVEEFFSRAEIEEHGFSSLSTITGEANGKIYCCPTRKALNWTRLQEAECDVEFNNKIFNAIRDMGVTHIFRVTAHYNDYWFGGPDYKLEPAICVMVVGAKL